MNRNIEIKARVPDLRSVATRAEAIADKGPFIIDQMDTFFHCPKGRLKLRRLSDSEAELIFYDRPDGTAPKESRYIRTSTAAPDELHDILSNSLGVRGVVQKRRLLYLAGQTRIHLDEVEGLGQFAELEVVLEPEQTAADGACIAQELMELLGINDSDLLDKAYIDLLIEDVG